MVRFGYLSTREENEVQVAKEDKLFYKNAREEKIGKLESVRHELIKRACRKQEWANLNFKSESSVWSSMLDNVYGDFCEEIWLGEGIAMMRAGWREFIKTL